MNNQIHPLCTHAVLFTFAVVAQFAKAFLRAGTSPLRSTGRSARLVRGSNRSVHAVGTLADSMAILALLTGVSLVVEYLLRCPSAFLRRALPRLLAVIHTDKWTDRECLEWVAAAGACSLTEDLAWIVR